MTQSYDVVVIGGGISGAALAYYLKTGGVKRVLLLERGAPASGGTGKSAAIVRQHYSTPLMARLARRSVEIFTELPKAVGKDAGFRQTGYYIIFPAPLVEAAKKNVAMQKTVGVDTDWVETDELARRLAWLNPEGVAGGCFERLGGYADPVQSVEAYVHGFTQAGGELRQRAPVRALLRKGDRITGVMTDDGEITAGTVVNAAGPWSQPLATLAGLPMEMRTIREQDTVWEGRANRPLPETSVSNAVDAIYLRPQGDRRFIVGRGFPKDYVDADMNNYKETADDAFIREVQERLELRVPTMAGAKLVHAYSALYDVTPDWYQYVGPRSGLDGYVDFSGGSGHGFKVGPGIAEELCKWMLTGQVADDFKRLSYDRLAANQLFVQSYGGNRG